MVLDYEFGWADDPCDFIKEIVDKIAPKNILQVAGSGDHLLSFYSLPSVKEITAFDVDKRALALLDFRLRGIKELDYQTFTKFFNMHKFKDFIRGNHDHLILNKDNLLDKDSYMRVFRQLFQNLRDETKIILEEEVKVDETPGYHCINIFRDGANLANPEVLPWLDGKIFNLIKNKNLKLNLYNASLDSFYKNSIGDFIGKEKFDLIWPIDALDNNVDIFEFLNLCLKNNSENGHVMIHSGIKDPYIFFEEAFPDIMNTGHDSSYFEKVQQRGHKPILVVYLEDVFNGVGYIARNDLIEGIKDYFPRETNTWWDLDIEESWTHEMNKSLKSVLMVFERNKFFNPLSENEYSRMIASLPKYFQRGLHFSSNIKGDEN